jgi:hypothetical protein
MIYAVKNKEENSQEAHIEVLKDEVHIMTHDLGDDNNYGYYIKADKADFMKLINAIRFTEADNTGKIKFLKESIQDLLHKYLFTSQSGEDEMAYNAISMEIIELLESEINASYPEIKDGE